MIRKITLPGETIGIIGGGQLGRMMALSAREMGYSIAVLDPTPNSPCGQIADLEITAGFTDIDAIKKLAEVSDVITYEFENIDYETLTWLEQNANLPQGSRLLAITQDRATEKDAISSIGLSVAPYIVVETEQELEDAVQKLQIPCVVKTCRGGYDGKGQYVITKEQDITEAKALLKNGTCVVEAWISYTKEISVIVSRNVTGDVKTFPVAENIHVENILHQTIVPARIPNEVAFKAEQMAIQMAREFNMVGTLAVEMFVTADNMIYINELAPRPHNSGHYSIDACETSQFEQHIRAVCNWPLGETTLLKPVVMVNILGEHVGPVLQKIQEFEKCKLHLYGKKEAKIKRKMGHLTILGNNTKEILMQIETLQIWSKETKELIGG
ncbi:5-(carboxyamino)imidazole ribonucleotide synthase [Bacillus luteolus]|uniref:N5-carboxyaminoimidazole ribonucleotide synthase n=1 Tax=Litchfieldia luteola TaxID=682179 RepID=A0ABR9QFU0_9BACI|nr:5-(carboxyamino)imidazole ribonucleotide synthase [Cytobacillus luteolus]MBE4907361.1 5-(carboxyamino)imidazole ribonucleotide synthase [Cytobacillus luteolus]MBP1943909.1 5-(carboxyamino)imidazole ribonucleotide synthase [Cytobacillus luteolus]